MGIETAILIGLTAASAVSTVQEGKRQAKAQAEAGAFQADQLAKSTKLKASRQKTAFLNSGITLEGTGAFALEETFETGIQDVAQLQTNVNTQAKNTMFAARNSALQQVVGTGTSLFAGGAFSGGATKATQTGIVPLTPSTTQSIPAGGISFAGRRTSSFTGGI